MCSGKILRFQECYHAEEYKTQCTYIQEDFGPDAYCNPIRWLTIMHEGEYHRFLPGRCVKCQNVMREFYDKKTAEKTAQDKKAREKKTGEEKTGEEKTGEEKPGEEKTGEEKTGDEKTGEEKTERIIFEDIKDVEEKERRMKEVQDEIGFHF
ncbi:hypothetical protein LZ554_007717 [Drepanopeziza brunnea f. sp. 'monogermtubi']|nr:hypothetical protein LZ554_007717 [Drepanopeziza brunnea f. sp. 'monogermtubi']